MESIDATPEVMSPPVTHPAVVSCNGPVRQLIIFPTESADRRLGGLVRHRHLLCELEAGPVFHIRVPSHWDTSPEHVAKLAGALGSVDSALPRNQIESMLGWKLDTQVEVLDFDLAAPAVVVWPIRAVAVQRCMGQNSCASSVGELAQSIALVEEELSHVAEAQLMVFASALNRQIVGLSGLWGCMPWQRYNWFVQSTAQVRTYRIQLAQVFPALVPVLSGELGDPDSFAKSVSQVVDQGRSLIDALASICLVRKVTARHSLAIPVALVDGRRLQVFIKALDELPADHFPRQLEEWLIFDRMVNTLLPQLTDRPASSPLNLLFLRDLCRRGWRHAETQLARLCVDEGDAALVREFMAAYRASLVWALHRSGEAGTETAVFCASAEAVDAGLAAAGVIRIFEAARAFPGLLRDARSELAPQHEILRGERWPSVLDQPWTFEDCEITPMLTLADLEMAGRELNNCIDARFAYPCVNGSAHVFFIRSTAGRRLGALYLRFDADRNGRYKVSLVECKGPSNARIGVPAGRAVAAFCDWLRTEAPQKRIAELKRAAMLRGVTRKKNETEERIAMEVTIAALRQLDRRSLRFDVLQEKAEALLRQGNGAKADS